MVNFLDKIITLNDESTSNFGNIWSMINVKSESIILKDDIFIQSSINDEFCRLGAKKSWVPVLGEIIWELSKEVGNKAPFYAYIFKIKDGRRIGFVRIPNYVYNKNHVKLFEELIAHFENHTDALVVDQVDNEGGSMFQMYALLSILTNKILILPKHQITIADDDYSKAIEVISNSKTGNISSLEEPPSKELLKYSRFVVAEKEAGRGTSNKLSNLVHLYGVEEIKPSTNPYTKKIVVLINELDFSASEFLAAILQDNNRAKLFGGRTAGAGGCVKTITYPADHPLGIEYFTYTWTIAWRTNGSPIENVGVHPDFRYTLTVKDLQSNFSGYKQALLAFI